MSSGFQSSGSGDRPAHETDLPANTTSQPADATSQPADASSKSVHQELLDQVLQATLSLGGGDEPLRPEELRTLTAVARRRGEEPLSVETVTELVQAVLRLRFRSLADSRSQWERMTRQIAETMFDDPQTLQRIQTLWALLRESPA